MKKIFAGFFCFLALSAAGVAEVMRVEIAKRADIGTSGYEKITGTIHFAVDPKLAANRVIADLDQAPRAADGRVEFSADLWIVKPKDVRAGNGAALIEVSNRGGKGLITGFSRGANRDPATEAELGDRFLMQQGFTLVSVGWEFDVPSTPGLMRIEVPVATEGGKPISGVVHAKFVLDAEAAEHTVNDLAVYPIVDPEGPDSQLTVRAKAWEAKGEVIPRARWNFKDRA
ncbi:MAG: hypothetical protein ABIZ49_08595, partial [Opitutaceae bacterium]